MIAATFTDEVGEGIAALMRKQDKATRCAGSVLLDRPETKGWSFEGEFCYAPVSSHLMYKKKHPDHFGIFYGGYVPIGEGTGVNWPCDWERPEAKEWLEAILDPEGIFKGVLPYLWKTAPDDILRDHGFVYKNVLDKNCNAGLLWTFMQASRLMFENRGRMKSFIAARKELPLRVATVVALTLQEFSEGLWGNVMVVHGEPFGTQGFRKAGYALAGKLTPVSRHSPGRSADCFGGATPIDYRLETQRKSLREWVTLFEKAAQDGKHVEV